ncbi:MAG TPA: TIGR03960 family B12-binding radical SAM protein [Acidobacteriota bacterium]|nr:TIGR03960 family B12-binding radical SAM protein [Acidobacteriota bacterium]
MNLLYPPTLLRTVQKPVRYLGCEFNVIRRDPVTARSRVALVFPDTYEIGMSHWGSRLLYHRLNREDGVAVERFHCPWPDMEMGLRRLGLPLRSLDSGLTLGECDVIGFSLLYEMTFTNVITLLDLAGIPLLTRDRDPHAPLVIGGGPVASNPEPMADCFDLFLIGEGEEAFGEIVRLEAKLRPQKRSFARRCDWLRAFTEIPGVYVPSLYAVRAAGPWMVVDAEQARREGLPMPVRRRWQPELADMPLPVNLVVPNTEIIHDRVSAEISRGCLQGCRYCHASFFYRPQRERDAADLVDWVQTAVARTGYEEVSLASLSSADFGGIEMLAEVLAGRLAEDRVALSFPSLRVSGLSARLAAAVSETRKTGFTVAPEAGTQAMRDRINKNLTESEILEGILAAFRAGWDLIKLYFMIGLPFESDADVAGIAELADRIVAVVRAEPDYRGRRRKFQVNLSVASFIPKAHTPFQWAGMDAPETLTRKIRMLRQHLRSREVRLKWHDARLSRLEAILSRGDRRLTPVILDAWRSGARFDGWDECFRPDQWAAAFERCRVDPSVYLAPVIPGGELPWGHIDLGASEPFLRREWAAASEGRTTPACGVRPAAAPDKPVTTHCLACGAGCDIPSMRERREQNVAALAEMSRRAAEVAASETAGAAETAAQRYRITFTKLGPAAWLSHLDLVRTMQRILRRSGLPLSYTQGFHPRPQVSFGPALGVGVGGERELADVWLGAACDGESALAALNAVSIEGVAFVGMEALPEDAPSIDRWAGIARFRIDVPAAELVDGPSALTDVREERPEVLRARIRQLLAQESLSVVDRRPGKEGRLREVRSLLLAADATESGRAVELSFTTYVGPAGAVRPEEWLELCLPGFAGSFTAVRLGLEPRPPQSSPPEEGSPFDDRSLTA